MKLVVPPLVVDEKDSFKNDALSRKAFGEALLNLVVRSDDALVISLDGKWGEGKTTFVKMWQGLLSEEGVPNIYIDAFANDYVDDAFISIVSAITSYAESEIIKEHHERIAEFKDEAKKVGGHLLSWSAKIGIKAATLGIIKSADIDELMDIKGDISKGAANVVGDFIAERLDSHSKDVASIESFRSLLSNLPSKLGKSSNKPLVIIIDELDRCKPTFAVEVIEKVKHLFAVNNIVFVLVMNKIQLEESIKSVYGQNIDARTYLQKFVNLETSLPKQTEDSLSNDQYIYSRRLLRLHDFATWGDERNILECIHPLANHFDLSLRQLERVYTNLAVLYGTVDENYLRVVPIIVFLSIVKVVEPQLFDRLLHQRSSYSEVVKILKLNEILEETERGGKVYWLMDWVKYAILSKQEFKDLPDDDEIKSLGKGLIRYNSGRENLIPLFAQQLSMFSVM